MKTDDRHSFAYAAGKNVLLMLRDWVNNAETMSSRYYCGVSL